MFRIGPLSFIALLFLCSFAFADAPSFDCKKATTKVEKTICADSFLSFDDRVLNGLYQAKKTIPALADKVQASQVQWLRTERAKCENPKKIASEELETTRKACIKAAYKNRTEALHLLKASPADAEGKPPIKFKLMTGMRYSLCRDYVAMLNQSHYINAPICERKIVTGFSKFKAIQWTEITDKDEIKKIKHEQIKMNYLWSKSLQTQEESAWNSAKARMDAGEWPKLEMARVDIDHDGQKDTVYRFNSLTPELEKYGGCAKSSSYFTQYDEPGKNEAIYSKVFSYDLYSEGKTGIFFYDGRVFQEYWNGWQAENYQIKVNETSGIPNQVCGINIIQQ